MGASTGSGFSDEDDVVMSDINVTPLVDVVLVLLIVFMITVPAIVASAPIKVDLPTSGSVEMASELPPITVSVRRADDGSVQIFMNDRQTNDAGLKQLIESSVCTRRSAREPGCGSRHRLRRRDPRDGSAARTRPEEDRRRYEARAIRVPANQVTDQ